MKLAVNDVATQLSSHAPLFGCSGYQVGAAGLKPHPHGEAIHEPFVAAVPGLALKAVVTPDTDVHRSSALRGRLMRQLYPDLDFES